MTTTRSGIQRLVLACLLTLPVRVAAESPPPPALLSVIPRDCWAFVTVEQPRALDDKVQELCSRIGLPPTRLLESLVARLNLGPGIDLSGGLAFVWMPADGLEPMGQAGVLLFACPSVESLLAGFQPQDLGGGLWRAELVWGTTYVGQKGRYAVFGTSETITRAVLGNPTGVPGGFQVHDYAAADVNAWLGRAGLQALLRTAQPPTEEDPDAVLSSALRASLLRWAGQIQSVHVGADLNPARWRVSATVAPQPGSTLETLMAFEPSGDPDLLALLPNHSMMLAAAGTLSRRQADAKAAEFDAILQNPLIAQATVPERLSALRGRLQNLVRRVRGGAWGISTRTQSPAGLATVVAALQVDDAEGWLSDVREAAHLLDDGFFTLPAANVYYRAVGYESGVDQVDGHRIDRLTVELPENSAAPPPDGLDYRAALGPDRKILQLTAVNPTTVVLCLGDQPRVLFDLIQSAGDPAAGLSHSAGVAAVAPLLPDRRNATVLCWPSQAIRIGRLLSQRQDRLEQFRYHAIESDVPMVATIQAQPFGTRLDIVIPVDLLGALKDSYLQRQTTTRPITPPPSGN